ncbi:hypothetical protein BFJ69_g16618 [Fusarium oxysporum]|uniref:Uncharacterized protein n=1 Tax=Fusarium oxysporum TaxID=5507 RepID=A0A420MAM6_FUSOX|nr:hypothetical protein BFJ69_g16618 [Fusarium oxysporum]
MDPPQDPPLPQQPALLSPEMLAQIQASTTEIIASAFDRYDERARERHDDRTQNRQITPDAQPRAQPLRTQEVGFYNPDRYTANWEVMIADGKATTSFCIYAFTDRLRHLAQVRGDDAVKEV